MKTVNVLVADLDGRQEGAEAYFPANFRFTRASRGPGDIARGKLGRLLARAAKRGDQYDLLWIRGLVEPCPEAVTEGHGSSRNEKKHESDARAFAAMASFAAGSAARAGLRILASGALDPGAERLASTRLEDLEPDSIAAFAEDFLMGRALGSYATSGHCSHEGLDSPPSISRAEKIRHWRRRVSALAKTPFRPRAFALQ